MLQTYLDEVRDLLRDYNAQFYSTTQLTRFINQARAQTCQLTGCLRVLVAGGSPYVTDSTVGTGLVGAMIPGAQYNPQSSSFTFATIVGQEVYPYSYANPIIQQQNDGMSGIMDVMSVSVSWGGMRPSLAWMPWEELQAYCRAWNVNNQSYPSVFSVNGSGENGSVWLYPVPGQVLEMEWLVSCAPAPIWTDSDVEAIPAPFRGAIKFYAAKRAYEASQRWGSAKEMESQFLNHILLAGCASDRGKIPNFYSEY